MRSPQLRRLLGLCATARPVAGHDVLLAAAIAALPDFAEIVDEAEDLGIAPLAALHLGSQTRLPVEVRRGLHALAARHTLAYRARRTALSDALVALTAQKIDHLVLKGAALAELVYPQPALRAMRDVDLLLRDADIARAEKALEEVGFSERTPARPNRHEVVSRARTLDGFRVTLDLHRRLGLLSLPRYKPVARQTLDELLPDAQRLSIGDARSWAPSREDLIRSVYRHGFCLQLDEDRLRYTAIGDLATALEAWSTTIDWQRLATIDRAAVRGISLIHQVVPLSAPVRNALDYHPRRRPLGCGDQYYGWPRRAAAWRWTFILATLFPSEWWMRVRHGGGASTWGLLRAWSQHTSELGLLYIRALRGQPRIER